MIVCLLVVLLHLVLVPPGVALIAISLRPHKTQHPCKACGYDIRASTERCPECGSPVSSAQLPHRTVKQLLLFLLGLAILLIQLLCDYLIVWALLAWFSA